MKRAPASFRPPTGFTLVEVLLALALLAALLLAMNQFSFAITEAWTRSQDRFVFTQHTRAVTRHINSLLATAADRARASNRSTGGPQLAAVTLPGNAGTGVWLAFDLPEGDRSLTGPGAGLPEISAALGWTATDGLVLAWKSRLEVDFATVEPRRVVLSPFVTAIGYDYVDETADKWVTTDEPKPAVNGVYPRPRRLRLHFTRGDQQLEQIVDLPPVTWEGLPPY